MNDTGMEMIDNPDPYQEWYFTTTEDGEAITDIDISKGWPVD